MARNKQTPGQVREGDRGEGAELQVRRLLALGKAKQAVEVAKEEHKRRNCAESEELLATAYVARIEQFQEKGATQDAQTLIRLVWDRFPGQRERLEAVRLEVVAAEGRIDEVVAPLAQADLSEARRQQIEGAVRRRVSDLSALAATAALPADHPLRVAAAALDKAMQAVTSGVVSEEQVALPEVSRRSPLASWKMLVRAIAAFYRREDELCRRSLEGIDGESVAARLRAPLLAMLDGRLGGAGAAGVLVKQVGGSEQALREGLERIEEGIRRRDTEGMKRAIRQAMLACGEARPEQVEELRKRIFTRAVAEGAPMEELRAVLGRPVCDAAFWRMMARSAERTGLALLAATYWERFGVHAIDEEQLAARSLEAAAVYLRAAMLLARTPAEPKALARLGGQVARVLEFLYDGQPPEVKKLEPEGIESGWWILPDRLFVMAAEIDPHPDTFNEWWRWAVETEQCANVREGILLDWSRGLPDDPKPQLLLCSMYERRNALQKAIKSLVAAERIDPLNPQVRQARLRLTLATAWRHFKDDRFHLVEKDLEQLEALPAMREGDRPAFLAAMRSNWHAARGEKEQAQQAYDRVVARMGGEAATSVWMSIANAALLRGRENWPSMARDASPSAEQIVRAYVRTLQLTEDMGIGRVHDAAWTPVLNEALRSTPGLFSPSELWLVGMSAVANNGLEQAYLASAAGLTNAAGPSAARFLLLRARSIARYMPQRRITQCLRVARALAQQSHDTALMEEVSLDIDLHEPTRRLLSRRSSEPLTQVQIARVIEAERKANRFPTRFDEAEKAIVHELWPEEDDFGGFGPQSFLPEVFDDEEEDEEDEDDYDDGLESPMDALMGLLQGLPPKVIQLFMQKLVELGRPPTVEELNAVAPGAGSRLAEVLEGGLPASERGGPGRRRKRRRG